MMKKAYTEEIEDNRILRRITENVEECLLNWHVDKYDRKVTPVECDGWMFQYDNQPPFEMKVGESFYVKAEEFHRIIKGSGTLVLDIIEG